MDTEPVVQLGATPAERRRAEEFAYRALQYNPARPGVPARVVSGDKEFNSRHERTVALNTSLDLEHNFTLYGWMIRVHMAFVSSFEFQPRTDDDVLNAELRAWFAEATSKDNFDVQRRLSLDDLVQTFAAQKVLLGDSLILKVTDGRAQLFEAWQVARGEGSPDTVDENGLVLDDFGAIEHFGLCSGDDTGALKHRALAHWTDVLFDGFFTRPTQTRAPSPLLPAMLHARDYLDAHTYYLMKCKIAAMFGFYWFRDQSKKGKFDFPIHADSANNNPVPPGPANPMAKIELKPGMIVQGEQGDEAGFLESKTPPAEYISMIRETGKLILAALDIPYTFYDSTQASYASARGDGNRYKISAMRERGKNRQTAKQLAKHVVRNGVAGTQRAGRLRLPNSYTVDTLPFEMVPRGTFLLDLSKEIPAIKDKVERGWSSNQDACDELGTGDFFENVRRLEREQKFAKDRGVTLVIGQPGQSVQNGVAE